MRFSDRDELNKTKGQKTIITITTIKKKKENRRRYAGKYMYLLYTINSGRIFFSLFQRYYYADFADYAVQELAP